MKNIHNIQDRQIRYSPLSYKMAAQLRNTVQHYTVF